MRRLGDEDRWKGMKDIVDRALVILKEGAADRELPLPAEQENMRILWGGGGSSGRNGAGQKVKWLGVILDEDLDFAVHLGSRIVKPVSLCRALDRRWSSK